MPVRARLYSCNVCVCACVDVRVCGCLWRTMCVCVFSCMCVLLCVQYTSIYICLCVCVCLFACNVFVLWFVFRDMCFMLLIPNSMLPSNFPRRSRRDGVDCKESSFVLFLLRVSLVDLEMCLCMCRFCLYVFECCLEETVGPSLSLSLYNFNVCMCGDELTCPFVPCFS